MNASKNHHYIPKSVVKQFCYEGGSLLLFDSAQPEKGYRQRSAEKAFQKFHANTIEYESGNKSDHVEKWLADNIDSPLGRILAEASKDPQTLLSEASKRILARYLLTLLFRAPRGRDTIIGIADPIAGVMELFFRFAKILKVDESLDFFGSGVPSDIRSAFSVVLPTLIGDEYVDVLLSCEFVIAQPAGGEAFCLGDFPMMRYDDPRNAKEEIMHEYWFVLSPVLAACFLAKTTLGIGGSHFILPKSYVRRINFDFAMRSQFIASNCPSTLHRTVKHLGAFPNGRTLAETTPEMFAVGGQYER